MGFVLLDQIIYSGTTFFVNIFLARTLLKDEYGLFVIIFSGMFFVMGLQNALITGPLPMLRLRNTQKEEHHYLSSIFWLQLIFSAFLFAVCLIVSHKNFTLVDKIYSQYCTAGFLIVTFLLQEFFRRILLSRAKFLEVFINDLITNLAKIIGLVLLVLWGQLILSNAILVLCFSLILGSFIGLLQTRACFTLLKPAEMKKYWAENWHFGKWLLAESIAYAISMQGYIYLTAMVLGKGATAAIGAVMNVVNFTNILLLAFINAATPIAASKLKHYGWEKWQDFIQKAGVLMIGFVLIFAVVVSSFPEWILGLLYGEKYAGLGYLLIIFSVQVVFRYGNALILMAFRTLHLPKYGCYAYIVSACITLAISYPLLNDFGLAGAAFGSLISQALVFSTFLWIGYRKFSELRVHHAAKHAPVSSTAPILVKNNRA